MRSPGVSKESRWIGDKPITREAKTEPELSMELELPYRFRMLALRAIIYFEFGEPWDFVRSRSSSEATAEEWRSQDEACHARSSKVSRSSNPRESLNHAATVLHEAHEPQDLVRSRPSFEATAEKWRFHMRHVMRTAPKHHGP